MRATTVRWYVAWVVIMLVPGVLAYGRQAPPAAVVTSVKGCVVVEGSGPRRTVSPGSACPLRVGDRVSAAAGSQAKLIYPDRAPQLLLGGHSIVVAAARAGSDGSASCDPVLVRLWQAVVSRLRSSFVAERAAPGAASRGEDGPITLLEPRNTKVASPRPQWRWCGPRGVDTYLVVIETRGGGVEVARFPSRQTTAAYPDRLPPLQPGRKYIWYVQDADEPDCVSRSAWFAVLSETRATSYLAEVARARALYAQDPAVQAEVLGLLADNYRLYAEAARHFTAALELSPRDGHLRRALAGAQAAMGLTDDAARTLQGLAEPRREECDAWWLPPPLGQPQ